MVSCPQAPAVLLPSGVLVLPVHAQWALQLPARLPDPVLSKPGLSPVRASSRQGSGCPQSQGDPSAFQRLSIPHRCQHGRCPRRKPEQTQDWTRRAAVHLEEAWRVVGWRGEAWRAVGVEG